MSQSWNKVNGLVKMRIFYLRISLTIQTSCEYLAPVAGSLLATASETQL